MSEAFQVSDVSEIKARLSLILDLWEIEIKEWFANSYVGFSTVWTWNVTALTCTTNLSFS